MTALLYLPKTAAEVGSEARYHIRFDGGAGVGGEAEFDGPLELLLRLVRAGKRDPLRIEIAAITRQYLETLELLETLDLRVGSEFLKMASTLLRIKARRLLPRLEPPETAAAEEPEAGLEARLRDYARYRAAARKLRRSLADRSSVWVRDPSLAEAAAKARNGSGAAAAAGELVEVDLLAVVEAFRRVVARARARPAPPVPEPRISLALVVRRIEAALPAGTRCDFEDLLFEVIGGAVDRATLVAAFLAVLELARRRRISVGQARDFGSIRIEGLAPA